ncbi:MAG TPA: hypothetical protein VGL13_11290 [Polyangiaceae bacterium]|jgi:hypothetical protein
MFWEVPPVRRSSIPSPPSSASVREAPVPISVGPNSAPPISVVPISVVPISVEPDDEDDDDIVAAPLVPAPSTLAPSAYDSKADEDAAIDDTSDENPRRPEGPSRAAVRVVVGAGAIILLLVVLMRARHTAQPVAAAQPDAVAGETNAPAKAMLDIPEITDVPITVQLGAVDDATAAELQRRARELLVAGKVVEGVAYARRAISARPLESENYVLLAAGLEDLGMWREARNIFSQCVRRSGGPSTAECRYFASQGN